MRSLRLLGALLRVALMNAAQYRASFLVDFFTGAAGTLGLVLPLVFVYDHAAEVAGWSFEESLLVTGFFLMLQGLVGLTIEPNLAAVVEGVRTGSLDYLILKPVDAQVAASLQRVAPARIWDFLAGVGVTLWALWALPTPTPLGVLTALGLLGAGLVAIYGLWIVVISTSFWFVRVDNLRFLLTAVLDAGRWPVSVYRGWVRVVLTVVIPVAVVTSYPALALLGRLEPALALQTAGVAAGLLLVSRFTWLWALRHYTSASS
ncbi:MAG: ABC-2 family transporter protein [Deltaproteobacteria bacterium]|nr:ABC-2 family transporter protein [Deltaproteobacteria bacterium]